MNVQKYIIPMKLQDLNMHLINVHTFNFNNGLITIPILVTKIEKNSSGGTDILLS